MKKINVVASATVYDELSELPVAVQSLMNKAIEAREKAYAPYSKFKVGVALLLENNEIILECVDSPKNINLFLESINNIAEKIVRSGSVGINSN